MNMKTLGILGGVGPQTTSKVYLSIIESIRKNNESNYPPIIIYNLPFPFVIEEEAIIQGKNSEKMIPYLVEGAKILEKAGANFIVLPCNTLHKYTNEIKESIKIAFLSILEETALYLSHKKIKAVGILATQTTVDSEIYSNVLKNNGITTFYPNVNEQNEINKIIIELLNGEKNILYSKKINEICNSLKAKGAEVLLLACTDLQLIISNVHSSMPIIDTTEILIQASIRELCTGN